MISRRLRTAWVKKAFDVVESDRERYGNLVRPVTIREFLRDYIDPLSDSPVDFNQVDQDVVIETYERELDAHLSQDRLRKLTRKQAIAEALKISFAQGLRPDAEINLERTSKPEHNSSNIDPDLKKTWSQASRGKALDSLGDIATPSASAFTGYLTRLFRRDSLAHITNENFILNLEVIYAEMQLDIDDKSSTSSVAEFTMKALRQKVAATLGDDPSAIKPNVQLRIKS